MRRWASSLLVATVLVGGCATRPQQFEAVGDGWTAPLRDRTGTVEAVLVRDPGPLLAELRADALCIRNIGPNAIRIGWLGGACTTAALFNVLTSPDGIELRYVLDPACEGPNQTGYAVDVAFDRPVDAAAITTLPDWEP